MRHWKVVLAVSLGCLIGVGISYWLHFKRKTDQLETAKNNIKELALGIIECADRANGKMPPSIIYSKEGKPLYSWRVRILPYIGHKGLYNKLALDEPWNSPHNGPLLAKMPDVFKMPGVAAEEGTTFFQIFEGAGTMTSNKKGVRFPSSFLAGTSQTILIVEAAKAVNWAAPEDIPYSAQVSPLKQMGRHLGDFTIYAMADGAPGQLTSIEEDKLRRAIQSIDQYPHGGQDW